VAAPAAGCSAQVMGDVKRDRGGLALTATGQAGPHVRTSWTELKKTLYYVFQFLMSNQFLVIKTFSQRS